MKTIEERAREYAPHPFGPDFILPAQVEHIINQQRISYIAGATEQEAIDKANYQQGYHDAIEKARKWFANYLMEIGYLDDWMRDSSNMESGEERFIKAMEE